MGAKPEPYIGKEIIIDPDVEWEVVPVCIPYVELNGELQIEVRSGDGSGYKIPLKKATVISGSSIRAIIVRSISGVRRVSVVITEVDEVD